MNNFSSFYSVIFVCSCDWYYCELFLLQAVLNYLKKHVVCEEVCGLVSWTLGHKILSLCYKLMRSYDTIEFFYGEHQNDHCCVQSMMQAFGNMYGLRINTNFLHNRMHYASECAEAQRLYLYYTGCLQQNSRAGGKHRECL